MLLPIIFIVAFMTALTGALLESSLFAAKTASHDAVARYSDIAIADGVADFTHALATFVELHGPAGPWPQPTSSVVPKPACDLTAGARQCPFRYTIGAKITAASGAGGDSTADAAVNLQAAVINEQRVSATVTATIMSPAGAVAGTRTRFLTYRVFDTAPYAVVSGARDITSPNAAQSAAQGDSGGSAAQGDSGGSAAAETAAAMTQTTGSDDTRIHVRLTCSAQGGNRELPWGNAAHAAYETPCTSADAPTDAFRDERWVNGDANALGWTQ